MSVVLGRVDHVARVEHHCDHCLTRILAGERYERTRLVWDGEPTTFRAHVECRDASSVYHDLADLRSDEGVLLHELELDDHDWLREEHPVVAARLGLVPRDTCKPGVSVDG